MTDVHITLSMAHQMSRDAVAAEREACAKIAEDYARRAFASPHGADVAGVAADHIAEAIRKRTQQ